MTTEVRARLGAKLAEITPGRHRRVLLHQRRRRGQRERLQDRARGHRPSEDPGALPLVPRRHRRRRSRPPAIRAAGASRRCRASCTCSTRITASRAAGTTRRRRCAYLEEVIQLEGPHTIAAFILETVTGTNGILVPPDGYLQGVRALCDKYGILMIADEVMSGFGRTGKWFADRALGRRARHDHDGQGADELLHPARRRRHAPAASRITSRTRCFPGGLTYSSHPLACAAALATIAVYEEDGLIARAQQTGELLADAARRPRGAASVGRRRPLDRPLRHRRAGAQPADARADGAVQRHVARDGGARQVLPRRRALHASSAGTTSSPTRRCASPRTSCARGSRSSTAAWRSRTRPFFRRRGRSLDRPSPAGGPEDPPLRTVRQRREGPGEDAVPVAIASGDAYSSGRWLTPPRQGMKIIAVGATRDMNSESWYARLIMRPAPGRGASQAAATASTIAGAQRAGGSALIGSTRTVDAAARGDRRAGAPRWRPSTASRRASVDVADVDLEPRRGSARC